MTDAAQTPQPLVTDEAALEAAIGRTPPGIGLKVIDHLDAMALHWLSQSPFLFAGFGEGSDLAITVGGGQPAFANADAGHLRLPLALLDDPACACAGRSFGSLWLAPGIGETLRINGTVAEVNGHEAVIAVEECYVHCAKALIRSDFWAAAPVTEIHEDAASFVAASRFLALATMNQAGEADLSPKGDPAGGMAMLEKDVLWFADRPGNRRADSFRNLLSQPVLAAILLVPGSDQVAMVRGRARITTDEAMRARFAVQGRQPLLAIGVEDVRIDLRRSEALGRARLWPLEAAAKDIHPARMFIAHMKLHKDKRLAAKLAGAVFSIPGLMQQGLDRDYRDNLY